MFLTIYGPVGHKEEAIIDSRGAKLGALLRDCENIRIDGRMDPDWKNFIPAKNTRIEATARAGGLETATIIAIIGLTLSVLSSALSYLLTPKPKKPKLDKPIEAFGLAGFTNTTGRGTPAFVPYGLNRIFGHVISSGATVSPDGKEMRGRVLYFMGDAGGDGIGGISDIEIDKTSIAQIPEIVVHFRPGTNDQPVIPEFENDDDLFSDGRTIDFNPEALPGTPLIYTCKNSVHRVTLFFNFPGGLYRITDKGKTRQAGVRYSIEIAPAGSGTWSSLPNAGWYEQVKGGMFKTYEITFPSQGIWDIRITAIMADGYESDGQFVGDAILFNVQETLFTNRRYPQWALLGLVNIPSKKIRSLEQMACSAMVEGKRVKVPNASGGFDLGYSRQRCWIVRDMMTHPIVGMGSEIDESEIDDQQWRTEAQDYYDQLVPGLPGQPMEVRDVCDYVVNQSDWDWEHIKKVCGEARGRIIPSGDKWKYVVDKPGTPNLLYAEGANIIENSITLEISRPDKPFSEITAQFRDAEQDYENNFSSPIVDPEAISPVQELLQYDTLTRESEVQRENLITWKRAFLERRRWSFTSPGGAVVSEPLDLDYLAERAIGNEGSYSGFLPAGSGTTYVVLPEIVTLEAGVNYALIVKHKGDNATEYRQVSTPAGVWGSITVISAFVQAPAEGDIFSLGIENIENIITRAAELEIDGDGHVRQVRVEYIPDIYTQDPLPSKVARRRFAPADNRPPIPLRDAQVSEEVAMNRDGSVRSILIFDVTPGLHKSSGVLRLATGFLDRVAVDNTEPPFNDYYNGAKFSIIANTAAGQQSKVADYDGPNRVAFLSPELSVLPDATSNYTMEWERFGEFGGFKVEISEDTNNEDTVAFPDGVNFSNLATSYDTHWEMDGRGAGPGLVFFRFTPISRTGTENVLGRIIRQVQIQGDLSAPDPPVSVTITSYLLTVKVLVKMQRPMAEDFNGVEVHLYRATDFTAPLEVTRFGAPTDNAISGTMQVECNFNLGARVPPEAYGTTIWAQACAVDFSQNKSAFTQVPELTTLTPDPAAAGVGTAGPPSKPTGLILFSGVSVDPVDGTSKPFLDIYWNLNPEPDMDRYEIMYRQVVAPPAATLLTGRMVQHPQISIREYGIIGGVPYEGAIQSIDVGNNKSGFTDFVLVQGGITARDVTPPPAPAAFSIVGGFKLISIFFTPPDVPDLAATEIYLSTTNDLGTAFPWGESPATSISFTATRLANDQQYYIWLRSKDHSGNVGPFDRGQFDGHPAHTLAIGPNDLVVDNAVITNTAQIANAIITNAHIIDLAADKITAGTLTVFVNLGIGGRVSLDGPSRLITVLDDQSTPSFPVGVPRVQMGRLGGGLGDWGLIIRGHNGDIWHSFTEGTLTAGRQEVNETLIPFSLSAGDARNWLMAPYYTRNDATQIIVRITCIGYNRTTAKEITYGPLRVISQEFTLGSPANPIGRKMVVSLGILSGVDGTDTAATGTLQVNYW